MMSVLLLGFLAALQEERLPGSLKEVHVVAKADVWFASFQGSGRLEEWFGRKREENDAPRFSYDGEGRSGRTEPVPGLELQVLWEDEEYKYQGVRGQFRYGSWSDSGSIDAAFSVDGTAVPTGSPFHSRYRLWYASLAYMVGIRPPSVPIDAWGWMGAHLHAERFKMTTVSGDLKDGSGGLGFGIGAHLEARPWSFLFAAGELSGSILTGGPEFQAAISAGLAWGSFRVEGGYRHFWSAWGDDPEFRLSMGGPFVGVSGRF